MPESDAGSARPPSERDRRDRSRARGWALQILYRWEAGGGVGTLDDALSETEGTRLISPRRRPLVERLLSTLDEHLPQVDEALQAELENWRLERLSSIDRGVLRLAAAEILYLSDIPPKASIQEAIRLAETYGGPESPRFVNGVLDAVFKRDR